LREFAKEEGTRMIRSFVLLLALVGPALAEQPSGQLHELCMEQSAGRFGDLLDTASRQEEDFDRILQQADKMASLLYQRCMLENGFRFHTGNRYCSAELDDDLGPFDALCYERVR
jgi:hypothetical protein